MENQINHLGRIAEEILDVLKKFQSQIMEALNHLKKLPDLMEKVMKTIQKSANDQIQASGEMEIIKQTASLAAKRHHIAAENEAIEDFKHQLQEDIDYIKQRYSQINDELDQEAKKRVRELDAHLLNLPDHFPREFIDGYRKRITPLMQKLKHDNDLSNQQRGELIGKALRQVIRQIDAFLDARNAFFEKIDDYQLDEKLDEPATYHLPLWVIESDQGKNLFVPGKMEDESTAFESNFKYKPDQALETYYQEISGKDKQDRVDYILDAMAWKSTPQSKEQLEQRLFDFASSQFPSDDAHVKRAVKQILQHSNLRTLNS